MKTRTFTWAALAALAACLPLGAAAHGALAVGLPDDVAKKGIAIGYSFGYATRAAAEQRAQQECQTFVDAPPATRELCRVVDVFVNECVVIALDPAPGTPGVGWAIGGRSAASELALQRCVATAGESRKGFCKVMDVRCDSAP
jgi:hypothetical protein